MDTEPRKEYILSKLSANQSSHPYTMTDSQDIAMEINTSASLSLISDEPQKLLRTKVTVIKQATAIQYS